MDMENLAKLISQFLDPVIQERNTQVLILLLIVVVVTIIGFVANVLLQLFLKNRDVKNIIKTKRAEKTIVAFHEVFSQMEEISSFLLTYVPDKHEVMISLSTKIRNLRRLGRISRLSLSKGSLMVVDEFADYCSVVLSDLRKRDVRKEDKLIERFKKEYCRL